jgi:PAS domain S-box-containing protein/putative nucleotidyltransferase with HDIG domain
MKLRVKLPLVYTLLIAALGAAFIVFTSRLVERRMVGEARDYFGSLAKTLAMNTANAIALKDYAALRDFAGNMAHGEHVSYVIILDETGQVLAHSRRELEGKILADPVSRAAVAADGLLMQPVGADILDVTAPLQVAGRKWGAVRIGYSLTEMQHKVAQARNLVLLAGLLATLAGAAVAVFIAGRITGRLHALHRGAEIIGAGDLDYRLADSANDEIGQLATAFNAMTGHLRENYQAIEQAKHEWETSLDAVSDPLFIHDKEFKVMRCNRAYSQAAGMPFKEIIGKPYYEVFPQTDGPMLGCYAALELQEDGEEEIAVPAAGRVFNAKFYLVRDVNGAYLYSLHILQDITERKRAEEKLKNSEAGLARAQRIAHLGNWEWNMATGELSWSDEIYRIFGLAPHEFGATYEAFLNFVPPEDRELVTQSVNAALAGGKTYSIDHRIVLPDGSVRVVHEEAEVSRDREGRPVQMSGTVHDITERKKAEKELHELFTAALESLASAIEAKSPWTRGHSERVADYAVGIGQALGLANGELKKLRIAALLHDIGKIGTYDGILEKPGKLTGAEYETIKQHPGKGAAMLAPIRQLHDIIPWIRGHHERFDGTGYPDGLKGENIPLQARILAVADTFDAMTAERPYRATPGKAQALEEIQRHAGTQFDPKAVEAFLRMASLAASPPGGKNHVTEAIHEQVMS